MNVAELFENVRVIERGAPLGELDMAQPSSGVNTMNRLAVPLRSYSWRAGWPGCGGIGARVSATSCLEVSSRHTSGRAGSCGG